MQHVAPFQSMSLGVAECNPMGGSQARQKYTSLWGKSEGFCSGLQVCAVQVLIRRASVSSSSFVRLQVALQTALSAPNTYMSAAAAKKISKGMAGFAGTAGLERACTTAEHVPNPP